MAENINLTIEELNTAIVGLTADLGQCCVSKGQDIESPKSDGEISVGEDEQFPDQESYFDAKCNVSNAIYDTIKGKVDWLRNNNVDLLAGALGGVTTAIALGLLLSGPVGWAIQLASVTLIAISTFVISKALDFEDLQNALIDVHDEIVVALYNASNTATAKTSFIAELAASSVPTTDLEKDLIGLMLSNDLLNQLFGPRDDVAAYQSPSPVDCGAALLQVWSFVASGEGWSFRDDSTGAYTAAGVWNSGAEAWRMTITGPGTGPGPHARGTILITGLSIVVPAGGSVQFDHGATGDGVIGSRRIKAIFSDVTEQQFTATSTKTAGTAVMTIAAAKTIAELEISLGRNWSNPFNTTRDVEEVRVIGI